MGTTILHLSSMSLDLLLASTFVRLELICGCRYPTMTRFFAHLCLYLQMIDIPVAPLATQIVLEAYLQVLEVHPPASLLPILFPKLKSLGTLSRQQANATSSRFTPAH